MQTILVHVVTYGVLLTLARCVSSFLGIWYCYWHQEPVPGPKSYRGFLNFLVPRQLWTSRCVRIDIWLAGLRKLAGAWGVVPIAASVAVIAPIPYNALSAVFGAPAPTGSAPWAVQIMIVLLLIIPHDFGEFLAHAASHSNRYLWEFHKAHHSVEFMTPLTAKRTHFIDDLVRLAIIGPLLGVSSGILCYLFHVPIIGATLYGVDAYAVLNLLCLEQLRHSYIPLAFSRRVEMVFMSPAQHQLHHNRVGKPHNFGSFLAIWDRLHGSFAHSRAPGSFQFGLKPEEQPRYDSVLKLYVRPFQNVGQIIYRKWQKRRAEGQVQAQAAPAQAMPARNEVMT